MTDSIEVMDGLTNGHMDGHTDVFTLSLQHSHLVTLKRKKRTRLFEIIRLFSNKIMQNFSKIQIISNDHSKSENF